MRNIKSKHFAPNSLAHAQPAQAPVFIVTHGCTCIWYSVFVLFLGYIYIFCFLSYFMLSSLLLLFCFLSFQCKNICMYVQTCRDQSPICLLFTHTKRLSDVYVVLSTVSKCRSRCRIQVTYKSVRDKCYIT